MIKSGFFAFLAVAAMAAFASAASAKPVNAGKMTETTERLPAICTTPVSLNTAKCVCYLNFSNSPQFSYFTSTELNAGRAVCVGQFLDVGFILGQSGACNRHRQNLPSQNVNLYWLLGEANFLITTCSPQIPQLRYP